jgi:hypothetical protein
MLSGIKVYKVKDFIRKEELNIWGDPELTKKYLRLKSKWGQHGK